MVGHVRWAPELKLTPFMRWLDEGIQFDYGSIEGTEAAWAHLYGANGSMKRALLERVGGFDEERLPYLLRGPRLGVPRAASTACGCSTTARALVDHYRPGMTLEFWKQKARRMAAAERAFVTIHPEMEPWFFNMFSGRSAAAAPVRGRGGSSRRTCRSGFRGSGRRVWEAARGSRLAGAGAAVPRGVGGGGARPDDRRSGWPPARTAAVLSPPRRRRSARSRGSQPGGS